MWRLATLAAVVAALVGFAAGLSRAGEVVFEEPFLARPSGAPVAGSSAIIERDGIWRVELIAIPNSPYEIYLVTANLNGVMLLTSVISDEDGEMKVSGDLSGDLPNAESSTLVNPTFEVILGSDQLGENAFGYRFVSGTEDQEFPQIELTLN